MSEFLGAHERGHTQQAKKELYAKNAAETKDEEKTTTGNIHIELIERVNFAMKIPG